MKRLILLSLLMLFAIMTKADDSGTCGDNTTYTYVEATHTLTISGTGAMASYGYDGMPWYSYREDIHKIIIEEGVTAIGNYCFSGLSSLESVSIPDGVTTISTYAFKDCSALSSVTIPSSVTTIGNTAFYNNALKRVYSQITVPYAVSAFNWIYAVLVVPKGTRDNYKSVSGWKDAITFEEGETVYDKTVTDEQGIIYTLNQNSTDYSVYYSVTGHTDLLPTEITIPGNINGCPVTSVSSNAFKDCTSLKRVTFSQGITNIAFSAFSGCIALKEYVSLIETPAGISVIVPDEIANRAHLIVPAKTRGAYLVFTDLLVTY